MAKCPICKKPSAEKYKPFCSKRCADVDLGKWLNESYAVEDDEPVLDEESLES
ncbi:MAG: DNA gyrase inhibitor YacG [Rickettsiales bacterium]|nr:DNA gyrase inhibitor YacG [Pseudomonadota bacterium]MDA0967432.1 DNA gyrase inhibitor YacG [Pseudomonadota bacterium]MDG4544200.1 DNA gyrase inhibitor YacG [Rickettsiales bacterium]MDG4546381.1 DNA gyrase inhibitor YacG [Rickettsiales bacterium]MDG4548524.1 DNA gyrase inhibitor YacG [Rickettsiales bacterium]